MSYATPPLLHKNSMELVILENIAISRISAISVFLVCTSLFRGKGDTQVNLVNNFRPSSKSPFRLQVVDYIDFTFHNHSHFCPNFPPTTLWSTHHPWWPGSALGIRQMNIVRERNRSLTSNNIKQPLTLKLQALGQV